VRCGDEKSFSGFEICSKDELAEKAQDIVVAIPVKKSPEARYKLDRGSFFENRFWGRRPMDGPGVAINEDTQIVYILEFDRSTDSDEGFLEVKDAEANEQHKSIIGALKAAVVESGNLGSLSLWWVTAYWFVQC